MVNSLGGISPLKTPLSFKSKENNQPKINMETKPDELVSSTAKENKKKNTFKWVAIGGTVIAATIGVVLGAKHFLKSGAIKLPKFNTSQVVTNTTPNASMADLGKTLKTARNLNQEAETVIADLTNLPQKAKGAGGRVIQEQAEQMQTQLLGDLPLMPGDASRLAELPNMFDRILTQFKP